jgi:hypothetical protein
MASDLMELRKIALGATFRFQVCFGLGFALRYRNSPQGAQGDTGEPHDGRLKRFVRRTA